MTKATETRETESAKIEITLTRDVTDKTAFMDGYNLNAWREVYEAYEVKITGKKNGKTIRTTGKPGGFAFFSTPGSGAPAGAVARVGDAYVGQVVYDTCMDMIAGLDAKLPKSDEQIALEDKTAENKRIGDENVRQAAAARKERESHSGWCKRCQDWTYGDCGHM